MALWQRKLRLWPEWDKAENDEITVNELATVIADRLAKLGAFGISDVDDEREYLVEEFRELASDPGADSYSFDVTMNRLYDWADTQIGGAFFDAKKVCWIDRFQPVARHAAESK